MENYDTFKNHQKIYYDNFNEIVELVSKMAFNSANQQNEQIEFFKSLEERFESLKESIKNNRFTESQVVYQQTSYNSLKDFRDILNFVMSVTSLRKINIHYFFDFSEQVNVELRKLNKPKMNVRNETLYYTLSLQKNAQGIVEGYTLPSNVMLLEEIHDLSGYSNGELNVTIKELYSILLGVREMLFGFTTASKIDISEELRKDIYKEVFEMLPLYFTKVSSLGYKVYVNELFRVSYKPFSKLVYIDKEFLGFCSKNASTSETVQFFECALKSAKVVVDKFDNPLMYKYTKDFIDIQAEVVIPFADTLIQYSTVYDVLEVLRHSFNLNKSYHTSKNELEVLANSLKELLNSVSHKSAMSIVNENINEIRDRLDVIQEGYLVPLNKLSTFKNLFDSLYCLSSQEDCKKYIELLLKEINGQVFDQAVNSKLTLEKFYSQLIEKSVSNPNEFNLDSNFKNNRLKQMDIMYEPLESWEYLLLTFNVREDIWVDFKAVINNIEFIESVIKENFL